MAGHSKWAQIKRKKAVTDAAKSREFGKFAKLIAAESKRAGGDINSPGLRAVIERARAANMPKDNIDRAVKKGTEAGGATMESVIFETYGPGGVALIIEGLTDNNNRTAPEIRHLLSKHGCELAAPGSASWAFTKSAEGYEPTTTVELTDEDTEKLSALVDALDEHEDVQNVYTTAA
jgi:YebC/PmpR family DNA-binding regulatory protein